MEEREPTSAEQTLHQPSLAPPWLPAGACALCSAPYERVGGRRIIEAKKAGVVLGLKQEGSSCWRKWLDSPRTIRLPTPYEGFEILIWGKEWTEPAVEQAVEAARDGEHPWICQVCLGYTCNACGTILLKAPCSSHLHDDAKPCHDPWFTVGGCLNPRCDCCAGMYRRGRRPKARAG